MRESANVIRNTKFTLHSDTPSLGHKVMSNLNLTTILYYVCLLQIYLAIFHIAL